MARPKLPDDAKMVDFTTWLKPATVDAICRYASRHDEPASAAARRVLERVFARWETLSTGASCYGASRQPSTLGALFEKAGSDDGECHRTVS